MFEHLAAHRPRPMDGRRDCGNWSAPARGSNRRPSGGSSTRSASRFTRSTARAKPAALPTTMEKSCRRKRQWDGECRACAITPEAGGWSAPGRWTRARRGEGSGCRIRRGIRCGWLLRGWRVPDGRLRPLRRRGHLVLTGRVSAFINVAGRKVQPDEVEQVLRTMPSVADVRVLGAPDAARGQQNRRLHRSAGRRRGTSSPFGSSAPPARGLQSSAADRLAEQHSANRTRKDRPCAVGSARPRRAGRQRPTVEAQAPLSRPISLTTGRWGGGRNRPPC